MPPILLPLTLLLPLPLTLLLPLPLALLLLFLSLLPSPPPPPPLLFPLLEGEVETKRGIIEGSADEEKRNGVGDGEHGA